MTKSDLTSIKLLVVFVLAWFAPASFGADSCTITVKSCLSTADGQVKVSAYNGVDSSHAIPASESGLLSWGESASVSCNWGYCDLRFRIYNSSTGRNNTMTGLDDICTNATLQMVLRTGQPADLQPQQYIQTCRFDAEGNLQ